MEILLCGGGSGCRVVGLRVRVFGGLRLGNFGFGASVYGASGNEGLAAQRLEVELFAVWLGFSEFGSSVLGLELLLCVVSELEYLGLRAFRVSARVAGYSEFRILRVSVFQGIGYLRNLWAWRVWGLMV